jgi:hypothetical protein
MKNKNNSGSFSGNLEINDHKNKKINLKIHENLHTFRNKSSSNTTNSRNNSKTPNRKRCSKTPEREKSARSSSRNENKNNSQENRENSKKKNNEAINLATDLLFNINDDFKTLIYKNTKLRELIVKSNETINHLV